MPEAGDWAAGANFARIVEQSTRIGRRKLDGSSAIYESGCAAAIHAHLIFGGGLQIVQTNGAAEDAADRAHTKTHLQIVGAFAGLLEFLAAGKALGNPIRVC